MQMLADSSAVALQAILELSGPLRPLMDSEELRDRARDSVEAAIAGMCRRLGIQAATRVDFRAGDYSVPLRLIIGGKARDASTALLSRILESIVPTAHLEPSATAGLELALVLRIVGEIVLAEPDLLLTREAFRRTVGDIEEPLATGLFRVLHAPLRLGISLENLAEHIQHVLALLSSGAVDEHIAESLIARLRPYSLDVHIHPDYLEALIGLRSIEGPVQVEGPKFDRTVCQPFSRLADDIFYELGVRIPLIRLVPAEDLPQDCFSVSVNSVECGPIRGLSVGRCFVEDAERLKLLNIESQAFISPLKRPGASIALADRQVALNANLRTWDELEFFVLALGQEVRRHAERLIDVQLIDYEVSCARQLYPELVKAALNSATAEQLTAVLRLLVRDGISIRDLDIILDRVCTYAVVLADTRELVIFDERLPVDRTLVGVPVNSAWYVAQYVRAGLRQYISYKYTGGTFNLNAILLSPEIERSVLANLAARPAVDEATRLLAAVKNNLWDELRGLRTWHSPGEMPAVLTVTQVAAYLRDALALDFPDTPVLAYSELLPEMNITPLARLTL